MHWQTTLGWAADGNSVVEALLVLIVLRHIRAQDDFNHSPARTIFIVMPMLADHADLQIGNRASGRAAAD